jgi:uncharacterized protein with ACT and thioredoxin-like domain
MLKELTAVISDDNTNIRGVEIKRSENGEAIVEFVVEAEDVHHLNRMVLGLRAWPACARCSGRRSCKNLPITGLLSKALSEICIRWVALK